MLADKAFGPAPEKLPVCALIMLAHGSRSASWVTPFESLQQKMQANWSGQVRMAYFEHSQPSLEEAIDALMADMSSNESGLGIGQRESTQSVCRIHIEPLLLAAGFHVQTDLPERMAALEKKHPGLTLTAGSVLIDAPLIQQAILQNCLASIDS